MLATTHCLLLLCLNGINHLHQPTRLCQQQHPCLRIWFTNKTLAANVVIAHRAKDDGLWASSKDQQEDPMLSADEKRLSLREVHKTSQVIAVNSVSFPPVSSATFDPKELKSILSDRKESNPSQFHANAKGKNIQHSHVLQANGLRASLYETMQVVSPNERISSEMNLLQIIRSVGAANATNALQVEAHTLTGYLRCSPGPILSGPHTRTSVSSLGGPSAVACCAKLRCMSCKMDVMMLDHHEWSNACTVELFRDSYPSVSKLKNFLQTRAGTRAYCCACSWIACHQPFSVAQMSNISWTCAGHQT